MADLEQPAPPDSETAVEEAVDTASSGTSTEQRSFDDNGKEIVPDPPEPEDIEEELEGVKLRGSKETLERFKAERLMQADYTRKTQEVAEQRRATEAREAQFQETVQSHQAHLREVAQVMQVDERLAQFAQVNWQAITDADPVQALKLHTEFTQLQAARGQLVSSLTQKQQLAQQTQQRDTARQLMEARTVLERDIKGWSPDLANKLADYGKTQGYGAEVLNNVTKPEFVKTLHKAYLYDQLQQQRKAKAPAAPAPPASRLSGAAAVTSKEPGSMSDAEFASWRKRQIAQRS